MRYLLSLLILLACCTPALEQDLPEDPEIEEVVEIEPGFLETDCGYNLGQKACDFILLNADGEYWQLSDHLGDLVLIDLSAMWCAPCQQAAMTTQETQDHYEPEGFHYVSILIVDLQNDTVEIDEQVEWTDLFEIETAPVLQGSRDLLVSGGIAHGFPVESWPTFILLNRSHEIVYGLRGFSEEMLRQAIEDNL